MWAEHNGLGYSGTDSGGNLTIVNSQFNNNRSGIVPNSGSYELCYPERESTMIGNVVFNNNQSDTSAIGVALVAHGTGIIMPGGVANLIERNYVYDHERVGIAVVPFPEENPNDVLPSQDDWDVTCDVQREQPLTEVDPDDLFFGEFLVWEAWDNVVRDNVVEESGQVDIGVGALTMPTQDLRNCFAGNTFEVSQPTDLEALAPCKGEGAGDWEVDPLDVIQILTYAAPEGPDYKDAPLPDLPQLEGMEDPENAPANPAVNMPPEIDTDSIAVPTGPFYPPTT